MSVQNINKYEGHRVADAIDEVLEAQNVESTTDSDLTLTADSGRKAVFADTSSSALTVTIPSASISESGFEVTVIDTGGSAGTRNISIATEGSESITGTADISTNNGSTRLISDGSALYVV